MSKMPVNLDDKYQLENKRVFLTGTQALVRLCLMQSALDQRNGLNTAGYVSGYRGSPLGAIDQQFSKAAEFLSAAGVVFEPGLNEDLAATAIWGTQQAEMRGEGKYDGVFGMWYGKGPGVDRTGDAFRHANMAGSSSHGGVLVLMGDDHTCESSTTAHQSEYPMMDALIPVMNPANIHDMLQLGLHGIAMSRYSGLWCGLKCVKDNVESTASVDASIDNFQTQLPDDFEMPPGGLNIRPNDNRHEQERRLHRFKLAAAKAYVRSNKLNHTTVTGGSDPKVGIVSTGKSYMDTLQALDELGIDNEAASRLGLSLYKVAMPWPLEPAGLLEFAQGLDTLIVVEEKRGLMEEQLKAILFDMDNPPIVVGKHDEEGAVLLQAEGALNPMQIAEVIGSRVARLTRDNGLQTRVDEIAEVLDKERDALAVKRAPYFCAGCPHNSSTVVPEGSRAYAGIGCHWMVQIMDRNTEGSTQMGGEGANWIGESHFSTRKHVFQNIGDGTYNHSGLLAIRAAIAANTNITFKLLYNDAVAMTGGQSHEGGLSPYDIAREVTAAGAKRVVLVSDRPELIDRQRLPVAMTVEHRDELMRVQKNLADTSGTTVLIYEQTCAAEKRRRRKRGTLPDPAKRVYINPAVCEGCGDCGVQSNCVAILPLETEMGRKRQIDQSACNKDFSCINGFCPSFVMLEGADLKKPEALEQALPAVPEPVNPATLDKPYAIALTGVGGTGVVTIGALLGMAAHIEGVGCGVIDMAGLAQKGGAVVSHIKLGASPEAIKAIRIADGGADLLLGCDELVSTEEHVLQTLDPQSSHIVINTVQRLPGDFTRNPDYQLPQSLMRRKLDAAVADDHAHYVDANRIATALLGDSIASNLFMLGVSYQLGLIPLSAASIAEAVTVNNIAVDFNIKAFNWGRAWVHDGDEVLRLAEQGASSQDKASNAEPSNNEPSVDDLIEKRTADLVNYQNAAYAARYRAMVDPVRQGDRSESLELTRAVATNAYKLMAYKDEYEVARLHTDGSLQQDLRRQFSGDYRISLYLAPPLISRPDAVSGKARKRTFGPWIFSVLKPLARMKVLRGTAFDLFGMTQERKRERLLITEYEQLLTEHLHTALQDADAYQRFLQLVQLPESIRGFGHVKLANIEKADAQRRQLLDELTRGSSVVGQQEVA